MTCLHLREVAGVADIVFHTFDEGKNKNWEGRCVPLIGFERWYPDQMRTGRIAEVCSLRRERPKHPQPDLVTGASHAALVSHQDATKTGRLAAFIEQEERRGVGPSDPKKFDAAIKRVATTPLQSGDRTSRSPSDDGSTGT